jgi:hypothetical protein
MQWRPILRARRAVTTDSDLSFEAAGSDPAGEESGSVPADSVAEEVSG